MSMFKSKSPTGLPIRKENKVAPDHGIADLDRLIEKYAKRAYRKKEPKASDFEELLLDVEWIGFSITNDEATFELEQVKIGKKPLKQSLFETFFINNSSEVQECSFKTERKTRQSCSFSFTKGFSKEKDAGLTIKLPEDIIGLSAGIRSTQTVECGKNTTNEEEVTWSCDSTIKVGPHKKISASLLINEVELERKFSVKCYVTGRLYITLKSRSSGTPKMAEMCYIGDILSLANKGEYKISEDEILTTEYVHHGKCIFRMGVKQYIEIKEENY